MKQKFTKNYGLLLGIILVLLIVVIGLQVSSSSGLATSVVKNNLFEGVVQAEAKTYSREAVRDAIITAAVQNSSLRTKQLKIVGLNDEVLYWHWDWAYDKSGAGYKTIPTIVAAVSGEFAQTVLPEETSALKQAILNLPKKYPDISVHPTSFNGKEYLVVSFKNVEVTFGFRTE